MKTTCHHYCGGAARRVVRVTANATTKSEARHQGRSGSGWSRGKEEAAKKVGHRQPSSGAAGQPIAWAATAQATQARQEHHVKAVKMEKKTQPTTTGQSVK